MEFFGVTFPGTTITGLESETSHHARALLALCEDNLVDSALALEMFNVTVNLRISAHNGPASDGDPRVTDVPGIGMVPLIYLHRLPFVHAHSVLYALDGIGRSLRTLASTDGVPASVRLVSEEFEKELPTLKHVRDSSHHMEDRARGLNKKRQLLDLKPILDGPFQAPQGGVLTLDCLEGNNLCFTGNDGYFYRVSINSASLRTAQSCVQSAINSLTWTGPIQILP